MPSVRCPSCDTAQHVEAGSHGYTCSACGKEWGFVVCRSCGSRFHSKPGATTWTCPRCGLLQEASAEPPPPAPAEPAPPTPMTITDAVLDTPQEPLGSAFPAGLGLGSDEEGPQDAFAMPVRESNARPIWIYVVGGLVALVLLVVLVRLVLNRGGDDDVTPGPDGGTQVSAEEATATMCGHVQQMQVVRDDALAEAAGQLKADAAALKSAGERQTAKQVRAVIATIAEARRAIANQQDTAEPFAALDEAIKDLPCN
ncbi:hypothetical protein BH18ACT17_BH18ACT17_14780 [soil metagenome]